MKRVEFRLLQLILSPVSGDRITLALLHWDGRRLRVASSMRGLKEIAPAHRAGVRVAATDLVREAESTAASAKGQLDLGLAHVFPVREGVGAALYWTPITAMEAGDPGLHFAELVTELRLDQGSISRPRRVTARAIQQKLVTVGEELRSEAGATGRVRTDFVVRERLSYKSPLSWKNGSWHHAVPLSLDGLDREHMDEEVQRIYGLVELAFPAEHVPVVVAALPSGGPGALEAEREAKLLKKSLASRDLELVFSDRTEDSFGLDKLADLVRRDVRTPERPDRRQRKAAS